jgi:flagellar motor switch protein FliN/FliY
MRPPSVSSSFSSALPADTSVYQPSVAVTNFMLGCQLNTLWQTWMQPFALHPEAVGTFKLLICAEKLPPTWQLDTYLTYHHTVPATLLEEVNALYPVTETSLELRLSSGFQQTCLTTWLGEKPSVTQGLYNSKRTAVKESIYYPTPQHAPTVLLTSLEQFLLTQFVQQCLVGLQQTWCQPALANIAQQVAEPVLTPLNETLVQFAWVFMPANSVVSTNADAVTDTTYAPMILDTVPIHLPKILLSIPQYCLPPLSGALSTFQPTKTSHSIAETVDYLKAQHIPARSTATLAVGTTQLSTGDLKALEAGDLIVLEQSHYQRLALKHPALGTYLSFPITGLTHWPYQLPAQVADTKTIYNNSTIPITERYTSPMMMTAPNASTVVTSPTAHHHAMGWEHLPENAQHSLWDTLKVDVHAEFAPAKIPVGHLKQMSEGLIVEVADLLKNQVQLVVNGAVLAHGELVIVGDKFGVLLTNVVGKTSPSLAPLGDGVPEQLNASSGHYSTQTEPPSADTGTVVGAGTAHHADNFPTEADESSEMPPFDPHAGIDPNLVQAALRLGIDPFMANTALQMGMDLEQLIQAAQQQGMQPNEFLTLVLQQQGVEVPSVEERQQQYQAQFQGGAYNRVNQSNQATNEPQDEYIQEVSRTNEMLDEVDSLLNDEYEDE